MGAESKYYTIGALGKAFSVIEMMTRKSKWELGELSKACGLPKGTLQRILLTLEELGYVSQENRGGAYRLTLKFYKIGRSIVANSSLVEQAHPACRRLLEKVNETVNLCIASGLDMVVVDQQVSRHMLRLDSIIGSSFPIYGSASGKVLMAFLDETDLNRLLGMIRAELPQVTKADLDDLNRELSIIRQEGLGFDYEEIYAGVRCIAAPVFDYSGAVTATVSCSVPTVRIDAALSEKLTLEVRRTAEEVSSILGAPRRTFRPPTSDLLLCRTEPHKTR